MIKILQIVPTLGYGGVAQFLLNYYKLMDKSSYRFDFITHGDEESFHEELRQNGSKIFYCKSISKIGFKAYKKQLKEIFESNSYDVVHTHDGHVTGITAYLCGKYFDGKIICHAHTTLCTNPKHRPFMPFFRYMSRKYSDMLLGCGKMACDYCFGANSNYSIIHNAVDVKKFNNISHEDVSLLRNKLNISSETLIVGHVGAFIEQKNHCFIVELLKAMKKNNANIIIVFVGDGPLRSKTEEQIEELGLSEMVRFVGRQENIPLYMNMFDIFILPSLFEGLPVVGIEAQSVGLKCIISEEVDHDVDVGLGQVKFLPINEESIQLWLEEIINYNTIYIDYNDIFKAFVESGNEIETSVKTLEMKYNSCLL